ncbi:oligoendopeptidase F [Paenibacillus dendritiformis]|nr:oligoendopeptidase F [Paenibacillus dendritiformis]
MNRQRILIMLTVISVLGSTLVPASAISRQETAARSAANSSNPSKTQQPFKRRIHMQQLMKRSEVPQEYRWKLQDLFGSRAEWDKEYELVLQLVDKMKQYHGKLNEASALKACFELEDDISLHTERLYVYASMSHHEDTADPVYQALSEKAKQLSVKVGEALSFITPEVLSLSDEELDRLIADPSLSAYRFTLVEMKRQKAHVLSKGEEALLAQVGNLSKAPETIYSMLNNADMKFPKIKNEKGEEVELTHGRYIQFLESRNRDVRRAAFEGVYSTYRKQRNTIAATLSANVTKNLFYARARKYPSALEMYLFGDNIPKEVYTNLIRTIHKHLPLMHRYMKLRKQLLQVDELHMYDLFAPVVEEFDMDITFEEAKKIVKESLKPLGENYLTALQEGFDNGWIDVYENEGKRTGAYSWGAYGTHPYVLLNHKDNLNSMFTLTHEMGHALHSYYSDNNLPYRDAQYTIFLAEVASTLNEALLMDYMLKKTSDKKEKMYLLAYYIDQFRTTVFRQTMFAEFELLIHEHAEKGEALTPQLLCEIYYDLNKKYYGDDMVVDQDIEMEWARIPHFYTSFYVYKYATGFSAAQSFAKQILDEGQPAVDRYLGFLKSGGSDYSINILQKAGVDMSAPTPIEEGMSLLESLIEEMEKMAADK